jgi:Mrp family chromosome partitioning ATPase
VAVSTDLRDPQLEQLAGAPAGVIGLSALVANRLNGNGAAAHTVAASDPASFSALARLAGHPSTEQVRASLAPTRVEGLLVLPAGPPVDVDPGDLLASVAMRDVVRTLREMFEFVVIDSPAVSAASDAAAVAQLADGVVVVVRARRTRRGVLAGTLAYLRASGAAVTGVVINGAPRRRGAPAPERRSPVRRPVAAGAPLR